MKELSQKYEAKLEEKQRELNEFIEKYNDIKIELTDQLDGKSDLMHNVEDELQSTIALLKEQLQAT